MSKIIKVADLEYLLPLIADFLENKDINISDMSRKIGIPRSTLYEFLYKPSKDLVRIKKLLNYLNLRLEIKLVSH